MNYEYKEYLGYHMARSWPARWRIFTPSLQSSQKRQCIKSASRGCSSPGHPLNHLRASNTRRYLPFAVEGYFTD